MIETSVALDSRRVGIWTFDEDWDHVYEIWEQVDALLMGWA